MDRGQIIEPQKLVSDFARAMVAADARSPTKSPYKSGIGPHTEPETLRLVAQELIALDAVCYAKIDCGVPYPNSSHEKCDWALRVEDQQTWYVEAKMMRLMGDNGKPNDNILTHILSPYPQHRSALTDCSKLKVSGFSGRLGILIYGYSYPDYPLEPAIRAFEVLAKEGCRLSPRAEASFCNLMHPVHREGATYLWELLV
jgi:hypothetical protein